MKSKASAVWNGSLKEGSGKISTESKALDTVGYGFSSRFEGVVGTNPEELIAAAHASCFSMALSAELGKAEMTPDSIETQAVVTLEKSDAGFTVTGSDLTTAVTVKGGDKAKIEVAAATAKENCPISKLLNTKISLNLTVNV